MTCDLCGTENIVGVRYKCSQCPDFDMCSSCESKEEHDPNHVLLKVMKDNNNITQ